MHRDKFIVKQIKGYSYKRKDGTPVVVIPHKRKYYINDKRLRALNALQLIKKQSKENDWSHLSIQYPNLIGITDEQIDKFFKDKPWDSRESEETIKNYLKHIKAYNKEDIHEISIDLWSDFKANMDRLNKDNDGKKLSEYKPFSEHKTIFVTSPRGGFEVISNFAYANRLSKKHFPQDLVSSNTSPKELNSVSLPYGEDISNIRDIVFLDDVYMSGEQSGSAYTTITEWLNEMNIKEQPRLHYMSLVANKEAKDWANWDSFMTGESLDFSKEIKGSVTLPSGKVGKVYDYNDTSAVVFSFSIPDNPNHETARQLYKYTNQFKHLTTAETKKSFVERSERFSFYDLF